MAVKGTEKGICGVCKRNAVDLYHGVCGPCRVEYGRQKHVQARVSEKGEYKRQVNEGKVDPRPRRKATRSQQEGLNALIHYRYLRGAVDDLLNSLAQFGYSEAEITAHWKAFGELRKPFDSIHRVRQLLEKFDAETN